MEQEMQERMIERQKLEEEAMALISRLSDAQIREIRKFIPDLQYNFLQLQRPFDNKL